MKSIARLTPVSLLTPAMLLYSCNSDQRPPPALDTSKNQDQHDDSAIVYSYNPPVNDPVIVNTSGKKPDILFNNVKGYLGGKENYTVRFMTECMVCEPVQAFKEGILFGRQLYFTNDKVTYFKKPVNIADTIGLIKRETYYGRKDKMNFHFTGGSGTMKYQDQSCNDADEIAVVLKYDTGTLKLDKLINASFFEFDMDKDGQPEQYLMGSRNCTQELIVLRIR